MAASTNYVEMKAMASTTGQYPALLSSTTNPSAEVDPLIPGEEEYTVHQTLDGFARRCIRPVRQSKIMMPEKLSKLYDLVSCNLEPMKIFFTPLILGTAVATPISYGILELVTASDFDNGAQLALSLSWGLGTGGLLMLGRLAFKCCQRIEATLVERHNTEIEDARRMILSTVSTFLKATDLSLEYDVLGVTPSQFNDIKACANVDENITSSDLVNHDFLEALSRVYCENKKSATAGLNISFLGKSSDCSDIRVSAFAESIQSALDEGKLNILCLERLLRFLLLYIQSTEPKKASEAMGDSPFIHSVDSRLAASLASEASISNT